MDTKTKFSFFRDQANPNHGFNDMTIGDLNKLSLSYIETGRVIYEQNSEQYQYAHCGGTYIEDVCCTRYWNCPLWKNYCKSFIGPCPK
jgi:hypothetical protein